ncbi:MAG: hypothetical protein K8F27_14400 [Sulfuricellaceae bacterium]|nr:hypothetical protein [Sulfuricellaceae bacterium]
MKAQVLLISFGVIMVLQLSGCAEAQRQIEQEKALGTIESDGYTWHIQDDSEGGNTIYAVGDPNKAQATKVASMLCKKYGRIAQFVRKKPLSLVMTSDFDFNCVK